MLTIPAFRWKGKCPKHPKFNPELHGPGAIKGGCAACLALVEIFDLHRRAKRLARSFDGTEEPAAKVKASGRQQSLFP